MVIYNQYSQPGLERQYNNRLQVPEYATHIEKWEMLSRQTEKKYAVTRDVAYGNLPREVLDVYRSQRPHSKTLIFIHGGYWQRFDKSSFHFVAGAFHSYGITTVLLNYPLAPEASMDQVVSSCRKAVHWLRDNLAFYNGDATEMYVAGHSAGAHLMAMLMADTHLPSTLFKGACGMSGLFNLVPIQLCGINLALQMDTETALRNSPVLLKPLSECALILAVGQNETDEFKDQSKELYSLWKADILIHFSEITPLNHFSIIEAFCDPATVLHNQMCTLMEI